MRSTLVKVTGAFAGGSFPRIQNALLERNSVEHCPFLFWYGFMVPIRHVDERQRRWFLAFCLRGLLGLLEPILPFGKLRGVMCHEALPRSAEVMVELISRGARPACAAARRNCVSASMPAQDPLPSLARVVSDEHVDHQAGRRMVHST